MMHIHLHSTARSSSFREARLCSYVTVSTTPGNILPSINVKVDAEGMQKDFFAFVEKHAPTKQDFERWTNTATSFFKDAPFLSNPIDSVSALINFDAAKNLVSHEEWIKAFQTPNIFETGDPVLNVPILGPKELLQSMDVVQRRQIYLEYTKTFIAVPVQQDMYGPAWNDAKLSQEDRFKLARKTPGLTDSVLRGSMGMEDDTPTADMGKVYAADSLRSHYNLSKNGIDAPTKGLVGDYQTALRYQTMPGNSAVATDPTVLGRELPPSRMKGALNLGAVNTNHLRKVREISIKLDDEKTMAKAEIVKNVDAFKKETTENVSKKAESLGKTFNGLAGAEKLMVVALGLYVIFSKSKLAGAMRNVAVTLGGAYLFQRIVLKHEDPIQKWKDLVSGAVDATKGVIGSDEATKAESMVNFLSPFDRENLELQGTALGYVADSKLSDLASAMEFTGQSTTPIEMNMGPKSNLETKLIAQGATPKSLAFLRTPEMKKGAADGISFVFYSMASKNSANYEDVQTVEEASRLLGPNQAPSDLFGRETESDPVRREMFRKGADAYKRLVLRGKDIALRSNQTLGAYIADNAVRPLAPGAARAPKVAPPAAAPLSAPLPAVAAAPVVAAAPAATPAAVTAPTTTPTPVPTSTPAGVVTAKTGPSPAPTSTPAATTLPPTSGPASAPILPTTSGPAAAPILPPTSGPAEAPLPTTSGPAESPLPATNGPTEAPLPSTSGPTEIPLPPTSGPAAAPILPPTSGPAEDPLPTTSGPAESPLPATNGPTEAPLPSTSGPTEIPLPPTSGPAAAPILPPTSGPAEAPLPTTSGPAESALPVTSGPSEPALPPVR